ncbi:MAG: B12-binding domain-containing radical SAM protein, partial [Chloroflexi bacterium]|nr:B12-binding domain-containing radical SAM protein [Chloroflexota bacterium]
PKPHTPFQWVAQETEARLNEKQAVLKKGLLRKGIRLSWQDTRVSLLEAALSRGDRRLGQVIYDAWKLGSTFEAWSERFRFDLWQQAFAGAGLDPAFYAGRLRSLDEPLPWAHIDTGVSPAFLKREFCLAEEGRRTGDCRYVACNVCGLQGAQPACREKLAGQRDRASKGQSAAGT